MLQLQRIHARYGKLDVLHDINLSIGEGERVGIFGHNGAGKTTLLRSCVGALDELDGAVSYRSQPIVAGQVHRNVSYGIGFVPQERNVFRELSVGENLEIAGLANDQTALPDVLALFPLLDERRTQIAGSLSGGQQQMLALGMALMTRPSILLLDEPTVGLAPVIVRDVLRSIRHINETRGTTLVVVEQNVEATLDCVERAIVIKSGRVIFDGPSAQLRAQETLWDLF
ncbi:ABC transporter ATP-binding protein [Caballeronia cordobensis]|uniref:ABC transporter ATP-binding protein n=1 Tax=Caballeronia cordobensis TaxID=1353886 RepID=UPI0002388AE3|nr:ABC transporter [Burkholderia sp. YI23]BAO90002.1 ABC transporter [Burkholderia sp. RPE67]